MNLPALARSALKRASSGLSGLFSGRGGGGYGRVRVLKPGTNYDWEQQAGKLEANSAVAACLRWVVSNYAEPELTVSRRGGKGHRDPIENHPLVALLETPNPAMDPWAFWGWIALYQLVHGMGYAYKVRSRSGKVVQLWPMHSTMLSPVYPADGSEWLTGWRYTVNGRALDLPAEDVIPFPWGLPDRDNDRLHASPLRFAACEVVTDNEAIAWGAALLKNAGVPAIAIVPQGPDGFMTLDQAREMKQQYRENFSADNVGDVFVAMGPVRLEKVGFSPAEMSVDKLQMIPESRICAALGVHAMSAGLMMGEQSGGGGQYGTAREQANRSSYENCLVPLQKRNASALARHLLPDLVPNPENYRVAWDYKNVQCMAESEDARSDRLLKGFAAGTLMRSEYRAAMSLPVTDADRVYYIPSKVTLADPDNAPVESMRPEPPAVAPKVGPDGEPLDPEADANSPEDEDDAPPADGSPGS